MFFLLQENEIPLREAWAKEQELQEKREEEKREKRVSDHMKREMHQKCEMYQKCIIKSSRFDLFDVRCPKKFKIWSFWCQVLDNWKKLVRGLVIKQKIKLKYMKDWVKGLLQYSTHPKNNTKETGTSHDVLTPLTNLVILVFLKRNVHAFCHDGT